MVASIPASTVHFTVHDNRGTLTEFGIDARGDLFIRETVGGEIVQSIPIGKATRRNISMIQQRLETLATFTDKETYRAGILRTDLS